MGHGIYEKDMVYSYGKRTWHLKDVPMLAPITADQNLNEVLPWEPLVVPMTYRDWRTGKRVESEHSAVWRVPRDIYKQLVSTYKDSKGIERVRINYPKLEELALNNADIIKIGEVGPEFTPLLNEDFVNRLVRPVTESGLADCEIAGSLFNGQKVWTAFKLTEIEPLSGDKRLGYLVFAYGLVGNLAATVMLCEFRPECNNMLTMALNSKASQIMKTRHTSNVAINIEKLADALDLARGQFISTQENYKQLAEIVIGGEQAIKDIVKIAFSIKSVDEATNKDGSTRVNRTVAAITEAYETMPGRIIQGDRGGLRLHEAFTYYLTHIAGKGDNQATTSLDRVLFGNARNIVAKADEAILALR